MGFPAIKYKPYATPGSVQKVKNRTSDLESIFSVDSNGIITPVNSKDISFDTTYNSNYLRSATGSLLLDINNEIEFLGSTWANGYGHRIYCADPGSGTVLRIAARQDSTSWTDLITISGHSLTLAYNTTNTAMIRSKAGSASYMASIGLEQYGVGSWEIEMATTTSDFVVADTSAGLPGTRRFSVIKSTGVVQADSGIFQIPVGSNNAIKFDESGSTRLWISYSPSNYMRVMTPNAAGTLTDRLLISGEVDATLVRISNIPTSDPAVAGALWSDSGTVKISSG